MATLVQFVMRAQEHSHDESADTDATGRTVVEETARAGR
jgi:hypothetical protein